MISLPARRSQNYHHIIGTVFVALYAIAIGATAAYSAVVAALLALPVVIAALVINASWSTRLFFGVLTSTLAGYALFSRGFAYIGLPPLYIGEFALCLAVVTIALNFRTSHITAVHWLLLAFMLWGVARTVPYVSEFGLDAFRDGVLWGYALLALCIASATSPACLRVIVRWYRWVIVPYMLAVPIIAILHYRYSDLIPHAPGSDVPLVWFKPGDAAVHLAGIAAFLMLRPDDQVTGRSTSLSTVGLWTLWLLAVSVTLTSRGATLTVAVVVIMAVIFLQPQRLHSLVIPALVIGCFLFIFNPAVTLGDRTTRSVSFGQIITNTKSVLTGQGSEELTGTRRYRLRWWGEIINYTFRGPYFLGGKGFGINLAVDDGFLVSVSAGDPTAPLRAPHNSHFSILARMGVVGLSLWLILQGTLLVRLIGTIRRAQQRQDRFLQRLSSWLLLYWLATMINTSFDPYIEGPQGGIWFWSLVGIILVTTSGRERQESEKMQEVNDRRGERAYTHRPQPLS